MAMEPELKAIKAIDRAFQALEVPRDRERVAHWFSEKYGKTETDKA